MKKEKELLHAEEKIRQEVRKRIQAIGRSGMTYGGVAK
jgi:hypothetical protein